MKKFSIFILSCLMISALIFIGCSDEENVSISKESSAKRLAVDVYPDFSDLLDGLYGKEYDIASDNTYSDNNDSFTVHEVYLEKDGSGDLAGYFVKNQTTSELLYVDYKRSEDRIDIYTLDSGKKYVKNPFDLTVDPNYDLHGFSPMWEPEPKTRFFGWGDAEPGDCVDDPNGDGCVQFYTQTYYSFWIGVSTRDVMRLDKPDQQLSSPCDCP